MGEPTTMARPRLGLLRDPLLHFVILGGLIFVAARLLEPEAPEDDGRAPIAVTDHLRDTLAEDRFRRTGARPEGEELDGLVDQYVRDEALYREAMRLGLDRGDTIVRRRVIQKMEFLVQSAAEVPTPDEADLEAYLESHRAQFSAPARFAFTHIFLSRDARGESLAADGAALMEILEAEDARDLRVPEIFDDDPETFRGDPFLLGADFPLTTEADLAGRLGVDFAAAVSAARAGEWSGPFESSYGLHAVRVTGRERERTATLDEARRAVERGWAEEQRAALAEEAIGELVDSYPREQAP